MKIFLLSLSLCFALASHAQTVKWQHSIPLASTWKVDRSNVFPDGAGGGALVLSITSLTNHVERVVWFSATGKVNAEHEEPTPLTMEYYNRASIRAAYDNFISNTSDFSPQNVVFVAMAEDYFARNPAVSNALQIIRVTPKVLDVKISTGLLHVTSRGPVFSTNSEALATAFVSPQVDKRGFFTTEFSTTNLTVRRYNF